MEDQAPYGSPETLALEAKKSETLRSTLVPIAAVLDFVPAAWTLFSRDTFEYCRRLRRPLQDLTIAEISGLAAQAATKHADELAKHLPAGT